MIFTAQRLLFNDISFHYQCCLRCFSLHFLGEIQIDAKEAKAIPLRWISQYTKFGVGRIFFFFFRYLTVVQYLDKSEHRSIWDIVEISFESLKETHARSLSQEKHQHSHIFVYIRSLSILVKIFYQLILSSLTKIWHNLWMHVWI